MSTNVFRAICLYLLLSVPAARAQSVQHVPFDSPRWTVEGQDHATVLYKGRQALRLQGAQAWLDDVSFLTGTIEFYIAFPLVRGFQGVRWQVQDRGNFEEFYLRSHLSGQPDANQYNPVIDGNSGWQLYFGEGYSAPTGYTDDWMHVRIVVDETGGEVYIDSDEPQFRFPSKGNFGAGGLGVYASGFNVAYFADFSFQPGTPTLRSGPVEYPASAPGTVQQWDVAGPIGDDLAVGTPTLETDGLSWTRLDAEEEGITNLARAVAGQEGNHLMARITVEAGSPVTRMVRFGYSDKVAVYLNGRLLYRGDNSYVSRDYRYLGTIGLFDEVPLTLERGRNELVFVVSEAFGGWGIMAQFPDTSGLSFEAGRVQR